MSSLVSIFFSSLPMLPAFSWSNRICPWKATIAPLTASTSLPSQVMFWVRSPAWRSTALRSSGATS